MSSLFLPTNIADLAVYKDIGTRYIYANEPRRMVKAVPACRQGVTPLPFFWVRFVSGLN